jgi:nitroreductase
VDAYLALVSRREVREYDGRPLPADAVQRILEAGRLAGSSRNRQARRFVVLRDRGLVEHAAEAVYAPSNLLGAALVVAIVVRGRGPVAFDAGRAAQNMMVAAWGEGIGSCPAHLPEAEVAKLLKIPAEMQVNRVIAFGYVDPERANAPKSVARKRKPLDELVHWETWGAP